MNYVLRNQYKVFQLVMLASTYVFEICLIFGLIVAKKIALPEIGTLGTYFTK